MIFSLFLKENICCGYSLDITKTRRFKYIENFTTKKGKFLEKRNNLIFFIFLLKNIACWYSLELPLLGSSNEYPQSMLLSRKKKNNVYPCKAQFYYIKVGFKGFKLYRLVFVMNASVRHF